LADGSPAPTPDDERLRRIVEAIPMAFFELGPEGSWNFGNGAFRRTLGLAEGESVEAGITRLIHPKDREDVAARWQAATKSGDPFRIDFRVAVGEGPARWLRAKAVPLRGPGGELRGYAGVLEDVSEDRRLEQLLLEEAEKERERSRRNEYGHEMSNVQW